MPLWLPDRAAILADGAERGIVVHGTTIRELVAVRRRTVGRCDVFEADRHVLLPGLVDTQAEAAKAMRARAGL